MTRDKKDMRNSRAYQQVREEFLRAQGIDISSITDDQVKDIRERVLRDYGLDISEITHLTISDGDETHNFRKRHVKKESVIIKKGGKGEAVRRRNPETGDIEKICECWYNADFARGCIAQVHVDLLQEVLDNNGVYASHENFQLYKEQGLVNQRCGYCYAFRNTGNVFPREVNEKTRASFEQHRPQVVRIGKLTEAGHPYYYRELMKFFELCREFKSEVIFPNKMFSFGIEGAVETRYYSQGANPVVAELAEKMNMKGGEKVAKKLRESRVSLLYSLGYDSEEPGAVLQGFTNEWRISQAERYLLNRVNVSLTVVCDVTQSIEANERKGSAIVKALESRKRSGINLRILPLRPNSREVCGRLSCGSWGDIVHRSDNQLLNGMEGFFYFPVVDGVEKRPYRRRGNNDLIPNYFHPEFRELYHDGIGVCGVVGDYEHCDKCNLTRERVQIPVAELVEVDYSKKSKKPYKGRKRDKKDDQKRLF